MTKTKAPLRTPGCRALPRLFVVGLAACGAAVEPPALELPPSESAADSLVLVFGGDVVPMDGPGVRADHSILVRDGRIARIGPATTLDPPPGSRVVDARGAWVLPGLIDMHVHIDADDLRAYVDHGVTTVRNMWGFTQLAAIIDDVESGRVRGPAIHSLSAGFDGSPPKWPQTQLVDDLSEVVPLMEAQIAQGYTEFKVYRDLSVAAYDSIAAYAHARGLTIAGHVPVRVGLDHALATGQRSIEHLGGYSAAAIATQAPATAAAGTWNCPTLAILSGNPGAAGRATIVRRLHEAGAKLLAGTDAGIGVTAPGASMADELGLLVDAGLSPYDALRAATADAAEYLGLDGEVGTIATGARADLLLLDADPLADIGAVRRVRGVMLRGVYVGDG
jgi:imidazolonepropionase-like amidohydrolase